MTPPSVQFIPAAAALGDLIITNGKVSTSVGGVENSITPDASSTVYNGWDFTAMQFRDATKDGSWTNDGFGLLWNMKDATNYANWTGYIGTGTTSGTFYVYETGTSTLIYSMAWDGQRQFTTNVRHYGRNSKTFTGSPATGSQRVDVYHQG